MEKAGQKKNPEALEGSQDTGINANKFKRRFDNQFNRNRGFQKPKNGNGSQDRSLQNANQ